MGPETPTPAEARKDTRRAWSLGCGSLALLVLALTALAWLAPPPVRSIAMLLLLMAGTAGYFVVGLSLISRYLGLGGGLLSALELRSRAWIARFARDPEGLWIRWAGQVSNLELGMTCVERAAALGPRGQLELGLAWSERGQEELALPCFRRAAEQGSAPAMRRLAESLRWGPQHLRNEAEAARWEALASTLPPVPRRSRSLLRGGLGEEKPRSAPSDLLDLLWEKPWVPWLCLAGSLVALPFVGLYLAVFTLVCAPLMWLPLRFINGPSRRISGGLRGLVSRAEGGDGGAALRLGRFYLEGGEGLPRDPLSASLWFRRAAEAGEPEAMAALAQMLATGHGCLPDPPRARAWFEAAAAKGHLGAADWLRTHPAPEA